jgi:type IV fimbrial biogenesis protein FimT
VITDTFSASGRTSGDWAKARSSRVQGFTLVELLVAIAVFAALLAIAIPSYNAMTLGSKLRAHANELVAGASLARSEAIKRNSVVRMCVSSDGASCGAGGWEQGWLVFHDSNNNGALNAGETVLLRQKAASSGFRIIGTVASVSFQRTGVGATAATLTVCRATPSVGGQERVVNITATGRASVTKTNAASCS